MERAPWSAEFEDIEDLLGHALLDEEKRHTVKVGDIVN